MSGQCHAILRSRGLPLHCYVTLTLTNTDGRWTLYRHLMVITFFVWGLCLNGFLIMGTIPGIHIPYY